MLFTGFIICAHNVLKLIQFISTTFFFFFYLSTVFLFLTRFRLCVCMFVCVCTLITRFTFLVNTVFIIMFYYIVSILPGTNFTVDFSFFISISSLERFHARVSNYNNNNKKTFISNLSWWSTECLCSTSIR